MDFFQCFPCLFHGHRVEIKNKNNKKMCVREYFRGMWMYWMEKEKPRITLGFLV